MDRSSPIFGVTQRSSQKRTHSQMEDRSRSQSAATTRTPSGIILPRLRFPGDGLDFRRPASTTSSTQAVIDLTSDSEPAASDPPADRSVRARPSLPPRRRPYDPVREVIDLSEEPPTRTNPQPPSPDVQFVSARQLPQPRPTRRVPDFDLTDPDFEIRGARDVGNLHYGVNINRPASGGFPTREVRGSVPHRGWRQTAPRRGDLQELIGAPLMNLLRYGPDINLDFRIAGFDLGYGNDREEQPPTPTYEPPPPAPEGFTRSPQEEEVLLCPNCGDELCTGNSDMKKQAWIIKGCGHVYCGECTQQRWKSKRTKGKGKEPFNDTNMFKVCVVDGCGAKCHTRHSMIQVFL